MASKLSESIVRDVLLAVGVRSNNVDIAIALHNVDVSLRPLFDCLVDCDSDLSAYGHGRPLPKRDALGLSDRCRSLTEYGVDRVAGDSDWQPVDDAPKDGTEIILANVHKRHQWIDEWVTDKDDDRGGYWMMCDQWDVPETPTHFKFLSSLPDAPPIDWPAGDRATRALTTEKQGEEIASAAVNEVFAGYVTHLSVRTAKQLAMNAIGLTLEKLADTSDRYGDEQEYHLTAATSSQLEGERD